MRAIPSIMKALDIELMQKSVKVFFRSMVLDTMRIREEKNIYRPDMVNLLMQVRKGNLQHNQTNNSVKQKGESEGFATVEESDIGKTVNERQWTDDEIVAQCFLFFLAGFETSSTLLSLLIYELGINPDVQAKLYEEISETNSNLVGKRIDYDSLQKMKYLDQVVCETLRKWPPALMTDRICVKDYTCEFEDLKFEIKKGDVYWTPIYGIQHNPKYFPNPEKFDPERFSDDNKDNIIPGSYIPFGVGPRNCIGSRFALMQVKGIIYYLILNFEVVPNEKTQIPLQFKKTPFSMLTENGIHLELKQRKI